jgi:hypothetical protein
VARRGLVSAALALALMPAAAAAAGTPRHVTIALTPRDPAALTAYAQAVSDPSSPFFRQYLTPAEFGRRFGASDAQIARVRRQLRAAGLAAGVLDVNRLSLSAAPATGRGRQPLGRITRLGASSFAGVQAVLGLRPAAGPHPLLIRSHAAHALHAARPHVITGGPQPCAAARNAAGAAGAYTADQIASAYGLPGVYRSGDLGAGVTVAVYELEPVAASDLAAFQSCYGTHAQIGYVRVDGGAGSGPGSGEAALDIENVLGYAPAARLLIYQGPNSDSGSPGAGPFDVFRAIVTQDRAQVVSVSWGECETALGPGDARAENALFEEAAIQGQTIVAADGDSGAQDCTAASSVPAPQPAVDDPSSQPFVTGVGGTTLSYLGPRPTESIWNNGGTPAAMLSPGAGGGGVSSLWGMPSAQLTAPPSLNVRSGNPNGGTCGRPGAWCREVPDVTADADPSTGYEIYYNGSDSVPDQPRGWQTIGGTSAASPVWSAVMALADGSRSCAGGQIGMALPALYRAGGADYVGAFNDVRNGNNDFTGTNNGQFAAGPGYDEASGLGSPNGSVLVGELCASALRLTPIANLRSPRLARIAPRTVHASDAPGAGTVLHVRGLPRGLRFSPRARRITGTPRRTGVYHVTLTAQDRNGAHAREIFTWTIGNVTQLANVGVTGLSAAHPSLSFTLVAGRRAPWLRQLVVTVPSELRLRSTHGIGLRNGGRRVHFAARRSGARLTLTPRAPQRRLTIALGSAALAHGSGGGAYSGRLTVAVVAADGSMRTLRAGIERR